MQIDQQNHFFTLLKSRNASSLYTLLPQALDDLRREKFQQSGKAK